MTPYSIQQMIFDYEASTKRPMLATSPRPVYTETTTTTTTTTTATTTTTMSKLFRASTEMSLSRQSDVPMVVDKNVQKFMRYAIPPEVKVSHALHVPKFAAKAFQGGPRKKKEKALGE